MVRSLEIHTFKALRRISRPIGKTWKWVENENFSCIGYLGRFLSKNQTKVSNPCPHHLPRHEGIKRCVGQTKINGNDTWKFAKTLGNIMGKWNCHCSCHFVIAEKWEASLSDSPVLKYCTTQWKLVKNSKLKVDNTKEQMTNLGSKTYFKISLH